MSESEKGQLIEAQKQIIGILFEIIKRFQANSTLDEEYFEIISSNRVQESASRLDKIMSEREQNSEIINRLLKQLEV